VENATRRFAEVQAAYEVLSDAQERAWYDSHRDAILRGDNPNDADNQTAEYYDIRMTSPGELLALISRFNSTVPFTDAPNGFFGILQDTFDSLAQQEIAACEWDDQPIVEHPSFGSASDDDIVARRFYSAWSNFSSKKSFAWEDKWRLSDAPDRRVRRLMEKENKQCREDAKREFNDAVRSLVAFVRKRDPRYVPNIQSEAERQKILRDSAAAQAARARAANQKMMEEYVVPDWAQSRSDDRGLEGEFSESDEESEVEHIECVICNKTFKTEKQYDAHEKSKKHVKAVQQLKRQMKKENIGLELEEEPSASVSPAEAVSEEEEEDGAGPGAAIPLEETPTTAEALSTGSDFKRASPEPGDEESEDGDYAPRATVEERLLSSKPNPLQADAQDDLDDLSSQAGNLALNTSDTAAPAKKIGKAKAKREKKAARQAELDQQGAAHQCAVCNETFESKTKLFSHIKEEEHAAPVSSTKGASKSAKGGKKKR
jgi:DnaJ homolog subfamily A member 5